MNSIWGKQLNFYEVVRNNCFISCPLLIKFIFIFACIWESLYSYFYVSKTYSRIFNYFPHFFPDDLRKIDLTSNLISEIDEDAFRKLPRLRELVLRDNKIRQLPELPTTLTFIDISNNRLGRKGIKQEAFKVSFEFEYERLSSSHSLCYQWLAFLFPQRDSIWWEF